MKFLAKFEPLAFVALRVVTGFLFASHGAQKLFGAFGGPQMLHPPLVLAAGILELVCGVMVLLGLGTRIAAFLASGEMAVGYFIAHQPKGLFPIQNGGEPAVIFCFLFLFIATHGAGKFGVDKSS
jgi:putative oxidoreductase